MLRFFKLEQVILVAIVHTAILVYYTALQDAAECSSDLNGPPQRLEIR